ncbi:MAG TPA: DUF932 domain-containing protein [Verrucomicrobiae bacterium]|jgi:hypothetical protein
MLLNSRSTRIQRFGPSASSMRSQTPLTDEQIRAVAPSVFADAAHSSRSSRYAAIPTSEVLSSLRREGFQPFSVTQGGSRDEEKRGFTKHMLRLRHESNVGVQVGDSFPEIVLVNSHDGTSSYQLMAGMFRLVCSNGMVIGAGNGFDEVRVKHTGNVIPAVIDGCVEILGRLPSAQNEVETFNRLQLTQGEQQDFATAALAVRYEEDEAPFEADKLLAVRRREDAAPTLWNTLNTIQENVIRGGVRYALRDEQGFTKQRRRTRAVHGIEQNVRLNRGLWVLAQEMAKLKAA